MIEQRDIEACAQREGVDSLKEDIFINITLREVPGDLVREFVRRVVVNYQGGISDAIQDLMRRAIKE